MVKSKQKKGEETELHDLDVFEEWEGGAEPEEAPAPKPAAPAKKAEEKLAPPEEPEDELDFGGFEEMEAEAPPPQGAPASEEEFKEQLADLAPDVPVNVVAVIGKAQTNVGELMKLRLGEVVDLGRPPGETVDVVANGRLIARGELVDMDGTLGVRILKMVK